MVLICVFFSFNASLIWACKICIQVSVRTVTSHKGVIRTLRNIVVKCLGGHFLKSESV